MIIKSQGLSGSGRNVPVRGACKIVGGVEHVEQRVAGVPQNARIDRAASLRLFDAWATGLVFQFARRDQHRVANLFGFQAINRHVRKEAVVGIDNLPFLGGSGFGIVVRFLLVGCGRHDPAVQGLEFPTAIHKLGREPVEQFGMARSLAQFAEVTGIECQPGPKMVLPKAVRNHARAERVFGIGQPTGERRASPCGLRVGSGRFDRCITGIQDRKKTRWNRPLFAIARNGGDR